MENAPFYLFIGKSIKTSRFCGLSASVSLSTPSRSPLSAAFRSDVDGAEATGFRCEAECGKKRENGTEEEQGTIAMGASVDGISSEKTAPCCKKLLMFCLYIFLLKMLCLFSTKFVGSGSSLRGRSLAARWRIPTSTLGRYNAKNAHFHVDGKYEKSCTTQAALLRSDHPSTSFCGGTVINDRH